MVFIGLARAFKALLNGIRMGTAIHHVNRRGAYSGELISVGPISVELMDGGGLGVRRLHSAPSGWPAGWDNWA